jgi:hypothetical protein
MQLNLVPYVCNAEDYPQECTIQLIELQEMKTVSFLTSIHRRY